MATHAIRSKTKTGNSRNLNGSSKARIAGIVVNGNVHIPPWVTDHETFRRWAFSEDFPKRGRFSWIDGKLYVEVYSELLQHLDQPAIEAMRTTTFAPLRSRRAAKSAAGGDILIDELVRIPSWARDFDGFRQWTLSNEFPERGRFAFLGGKLWVDLSMETLVHNLIKGQIAAVLTLLIARETLGLYLNDGMLLVNESAEISNEPDGAFVSKESLETGRIVLSEGIHSRVITGSPDMALEVVSKSSLTKDKIDALEQYANAGIREYWLVDSTLEKPELLIFRLESGKYVAARKSGGWLKSKVFGHSFRLACKKDAGGIVQFNLEIK